ncbi:MAG: hypothetical protein AAFQ41_08340 [Cyanobacteria bacterium J06623_7]
MNSIGLPPIILLLAIAYLTIIYGLLKIVEQPVQRNISPLESNLDRDRGMEASRVNQ